MQKYAYYNLSQNTELVKSDWKESFAKYWCNTENLLCLSALHSEIFQNK